MYRKANILLLKAETPMHAGSGDSLGIVDLPIQREKHTSFPKIEASSLKGSIREHFERQSLNENEYKKLSEEDKIKTPTQDKITAAFGYEGDDNDKSQAGALGFSDARLLLFPVKSMKGVFAWITCPQIISKLNDELKLAGIKDEKGNDLKFNITKGNIAAANSNLYINEKNIILEEYTFEVNEKSDEVKKLGEWLSEQIYGKNADSFWANKLKTDIVVLNNDDFKDFVNLSTEVITRTKINNETGTVEQGALFTEEYLPAESIMYSLVLTAPEFAEDKPVFQNEEKLRTFVKNFVAENDVMQIGGNATLGKGITKIVFVEHKNEEE
jgi:CRISPR-associated protein Cmr4